jgi:transcriptional regulator with GAF, ATPase, and Fis domain
MIEAGDPDSRRLHVVMEAVRGIEAPVQTLDLYPGCANWPADPPAAVVIAVRDCPGTDHPRLSTIARFRQMGVTVIAYEDDVRAWPVGARCRVLLAGAKQLLDSRDLDFAESLRAVVTMELAAARSREAEARNVTMLAQRHGFFGASSAMRDVFRQVMRIGRLSDVPVLIIGESGTGKELVGAAIRALDPKRRAFPFVTVNCAAISANLAESELFGHVRGAFTGALAQRRGYFLAAQGGVLFLDEIGDLTLEMQAKLLRVLEERKVLQVGADRTHPIDVRVIAATNRDIAALAREARFRADLLFRLNVVSIRIPPLRERPEDLRPLAEHFAKIAWASIGLAPSKIEDDVIHALALLPLHGNARELRNLITFAVAHKADHGPLGLKDLSADLLQELSQQGLGEGGAAPRPPANGHPAPPSPSPAMACNHPWHLGAYLVQCERDVIAAAMRATGNNQTEAARLLGVTPRSIYNKLRKHHLARERLQVGRQTA